MPSGIHFEVVREFFHALRERHTYSPRNLYAVFGFLWGLPIPFFALLVGRSLPWAVHVLFFAHPLLFAVIFGAMGTVRRHKNEQLKALDQLKAEFVSNVTHELKTPLVAIRGYNESILEGRFGPLTDKQRDGLAVAVRNVDRLQKLIEEILEFERIDSGQVTLRPEDFDLVPLIRSTVENFRPVLEKRRVTVRSRLPASMIVHADREKIGRVLLNLISNAAKFTNEGTSIGVDAEEGVVTVWDQGPGIPAAAQRHLFTRFWQADKMVARRHGGTGLGLAIVKGIVEAHSGTIDVASDADGTRVRFTIPLGKEPVHDAQAARSGRG